MTGGLVLERDTRAEDIATTSSRGWSRMRTWPTAALVYLAASLALHHRVLGDLTGRATGWASSDSGLFAWWLHWTPWALLHGQNPLFSTWQGAPGGVNAMWNTTVPVLGLLLAPVTLTAGPVAAFNVGMILGPVASALACYLALRPYVRRWGPRALAGALYGFGPFVVSHAAVGHLNLVWAVLPPVLLWAVRAVLVEQRRPWLSGALLGLAFAVQTGLYTQTVALGAIALVVAGVVLAARWPGQLRRRAPAAARSLAAAAAVYLALCAYPLWLVVAGPARPVGTIRDPALTGADLAGLVLPTSLVKLQAGTGLLAEQLAGVPGELSSYVGVALLLVVVAAAVVVRSTVLRLTAAVGAVLVVLSLGMTLTVLGHRTGVPLPWSLVHQVPILGQAEAVRLAGFVALCVAVVVGIALDQMLHRRQWVAAALVVLAACTWLPSDSQQTTDATVPAFFSAGAPGLTDRDVVATWPRTSGAWVGGARPLLWQSAAGFAYRQTGGYFIGSVPGQPLVFEAPPTAYDRGLSASPSEARADLERLGVTAVVVVPEPDVPLERVLTWTRTVTGEPGVPTGGVWLFRLVR